MSFQANLSEQKYFELMIAASIARKEKSLIWPNGDGRDSGKDFILFRQQKVEVKCDKKASETGNFFFEFFNTRQNQPSGIAVTKAEIVYHFVPENRLFSYEPRFLYGLLRRMVDEGRAKIKEGHEGNSRGVVMKIEELVKLGYVTEEVFTL